MDRGAAVSEGPCLFDPAAFSGSVPLFPLPKVVLFPNALLPLHIFEPRYRRMTREALAGERLIAMALLRPGWEGDYAGNPPVHDVVGVGKIIEDTELDDGRFNLALYGVARARIVEVVRSEPYRTARVELLEDRPAEGNRYERRRRILGAFYNQIMAEFAKGGLVPAQKGLPLGALCDILASLISFDVGVKQAFLEELSVAARCDRLFELLEKMSAPGFGKGAGPDSSFFPGEPSLN
jgi:hypothetical protein